MKSSAGLLLSSIELDRASAIPLYRQLYLQIRKQILGGRIQGGVRLPSTRTLSKELELSRITILNAFDQLIAEGFLACRGPEPGPMSALSGKVVAWPTNRGNPSRLACPI